MFYAGALKKTLDGQYCKIEDYFSDGKPKSINDTYLTYNTGEFSTAIERLGIDFIKAVGMEIAKITGLPYGAPDPSRCGHTGYVWTNWGIGHRDYVCLDALFSVFVDGKERQRTFSAVIPLLETPPLSRPNELGDIGYESEGAGFRKFIHLHGSAVFKPLALTYYNEIKVSGKSGDVVIPARGTISAIEFKDAVRTVALYVFDRHYDLKRVPFTCK